MAGPLPLDPSAKLRLHCPTSPILMVKYPSQLGIGATAARYALDVEIEVRILDPQLNIRESKCKESPLTPRALFLF